MSSKQYNTRQKELVIDYLRQHPGTPITADELTQRLNSGERTVGRTTVYRCLRRLCDAGEVRLITARRGSPSAFMLSDTGSQCDSHMHLMCLKCGKTEHLSCDFMKNVCRHITESHGFHLNNRETTLLGVCKNCREDNNEADKV